MSIKGQMSHFSWRCAQPEKHDRHRIDGDGYYGPGGYICDGGPMSEAQADPAWQRVTITVEDPDGATLTTTFPRVVGFSLAKLTGLAAPELRTDAGPLVPQAARWTDFIATGTALPDSVAALYTVEAGG